MQNIPLALAEPDMVLAKELKREENPDGPPICGKGVVLTDSLIARLESMGVQTVTVAGRPVRMDGDQTLEEMLDALDKRFRRVENDPLMMKVKEVHVRLIEKSMGETDGR